MSGPLLGNVHPGLRAAWHPVAMVDEVGDGPLGVSLLGERYVVARLDGALAAFADVCTHRNAPLSLGRCVDATIECPYHGWRFAGDGRCVAIPALGPDATLPPRASLSPVAVRERHGLVFLAPEPPRVDLPAIDDLDEGALRAAWLPPVRAAITAPQFLDNFADIAHFPFVHAGTFGSGEDALIGELPVERDGFGYRLHYEHVIENHEDPLVATGEHPLVQPRHMTYTFFAPFTAVLRLELPVTGTINTIVAWAQPETAASTRLYTVLLRNDLVDAAAAAHAVEYEMRVLAEDLRLLEAMEIKEMPLDLPAQVHTTADRQTVELRRILRAFVGA